MSLEELYRAQSHAYYEADQKWQELKLEREPTQEDYPVIFGEFERIWGEIHKIMEEEGRAIDVGLVHGSIAQNNYRENKAKFDELMVLIEKQNAKLSNESFVQRAPASVVEGEREKLATYQRRLDACKSTLDRLLEGTSNPRPAGQAE